MVLEAGGGSDEDSILECEGVRRVGEEKGGETTGEREKTACYVYSGNKVNGN